MSEQLDILDLVAENTDDWWSASARQAIGYLAQDGKPFSADDVHALGVPDPDSPARWGAAFSAARKAGLIVPDGYVPSQRAGRNGSVIRQWKGAAA